ncbi:MAG: hypothetical protein HY689_15490 [Chloroflexi bacterium]|nr:hypothetical protein [Chloroflexota bacterium]
MATPKKKDVRHRVLALLNTLPDAAREEVAAFLDYQRYKLGTRAPDAPPYTPVSLGGLWAGQEISDQDLADASREMWGRLGEREP